MEKMDREKERVTEEEMIPEGMKNSPEAPGGVDDLDPSRMLCCVKNDFHRQSTSVHPVSWLPCLGTKTSLINKGYFRVPMDTVLRECTIH
jgi:hypothetical protein